MSLEVEVNLRRGGWRMERLSGEITESSGSVWDFAPTPVAVLAPLRLPVWGRSLDVFVIVHIEDSQTGWRVIAQHKDARDMHVELTYDGERRIVDTYASPYESISVDRVLLSGP